MKILIIEDEQELAQDMASYLTGEHHVCTVASDLNEAIEHIDLHTYDCILLDIMLPKGSGMGVLSHLKKLHRQDGVIIISAKDSLDDKINGLQMGADDYLSKPFHHAELAARIFSVVRRKQFDADNIVTHHELRVDLVGRTVAVHGHEVVVTRKEFDLLLMFLGNCNKVISKEAMAEHLSGDLAEAFDNHDFVYAHVKNLKKKLTVAGCRPYLKNVYGIGYKWEA